MQAQTKKTLRIAGVVVVVAILILALWLKIANVAQFKTQIEAQISAATGYELIIAGDMRIKLVPLAISIKEIHLRNPADFAGSAPDFMYVSECRAGLRLMPLIFRNFEVTDIKLDGLALNLERNADNRANWDFGTVVSSNNAVGDNANMGNKPLIGQMLLQFPFNEALVVNGTINYTDRRGFSGGTFNMDNVELRAGPFSNAQNRLNFEFNARANKIPIKMSGYTTESLEQILNSNWPYAVQLHFMETSPGIR